MSVDVMRDVWRLKLDPSAKLVLMRFADFANADGENAFPSVPRIARECCMSERNVQVILGKLKAAGVLIETAKANRYKPATYRVNTEAGELIVRPEVRGETDCTPDESARGEADCTPAAVRGETDCTPEPIRGEMGCGSGVKPISPGSTKRSVNKENPSDASASRASGPPDSPPPGPEPPAKPLQTALLEEFDQLHRAEFNGEKATLAPGKDAKILRDLADKHGADVVRTRMRRFFKLRGDSWLDSRGYTVAMFRNVFPRFAVATRVPAGQRPDEPGKPSKFGHLTNNGVRA